MEKRYYYIHCDIDNTSDNRDLQTFFAVGSKSNYKASLYCQIEATKQIQVPEEFIKKLEDIFPVLSFQSSDDSIIECYLENQWSEVFKHCAESLLHSEHKSAIEIFNHDAEKDENIYVGKLVDFSVEELTLTDTQNVCQNVKDKGVYKFTKTISSTWVKADVYDLQEIESKNIVETESLDKSE